MDLPTGTIAVWSDLGCPWAHLAVHRLHEARTRLGLTDRVTFEHFAFPLELVNDRATPKPTLDAEVRALAALAPDAGFHPWSREPWEWPVTMLLPLEAVRAARLQGATVAERLDRALRVAFFGCSRTISMRHEVLRVAEDVDGLDVGALTRALEAGTARHRVVEEWRRAEAAGAKGSPHLFLPDGSDEHNPGITMHWSDGGEGQGDVVVDDDASGVYDDLLHRALGTPA